ncbi:MAG: DUF928 domain-containing protein [Xenococcaceae cyanobacterium MO_188.B19]|nr:DUF928 domain-containing protein [Xenococcaceae cyanobacterium MO_188.B19]
MKKIATIIGTASLILLTSFSVDAKPQNSYRRMRVTFTPAGKGHPQYTSAAAVRGTQCNVGTSQQQSLTPIVPSNSQSLTGKSHPTLLAYIPEMGATKGTLYVKNQTEDFFHVQEVNLPSKGGVVGITMSQDDAGLKDGTYSWFLKIQCGNSAAIDDPVVGANIHKVSNKNEALWYDFSAELANTPQWGELMNQINLNSLSNQKVTFVN